MCGIPQAKLAFVSSMMLNVDELATERHMFMSLVEFYEAVSCVAGVATVFQRWRVVVVMQTVVAIAHCRFSLSILACV